MAKFVYPVLAYETELAYTFTFFDWDELSVSVDKKAVANWCEASSSATDVLVTLVKGCQEEGEKLPEAFASFPTITREEWKDKNIIMAWVMPLEVEV